MTIVLAFMFVAAILMGAGCRAMGTAMHNTKYTGRSLLTGGRANITIQKAADAIPVQHVSAVFFRSITLEMCDWEGRPVILNERSKIDQCISTLRAAQYQSMSGQDQDLSGKIDTLIFEGEDGTNLGEIWFYMGAVGRIGPGWKTFLTEIQRDQAARLASAVTRASAARPLRQVTAVARGPHSPGDPFEGGPILDDEELKGTVAALLKGPPPECRRGATVDLPEGPLQKRLLALLQSQDPRLYSYNISEKILPLRVEMEGATGIKGVVVLLPLVPY